MCAEMAADLEPCYALVWHAAHCHDHSPEEARLMACHAKAHVSEMSKGIAKESYRGSWWHGFHRLAWPTLLVQTNWIKSSNSW